MKQVVVIVIFYEDAFFVLFFVLYIYLNIYLNANTKHETIKR